MDAKEKDTFLTFLIGRYDPYYDAVNNKGNLYLTLNTFILGGVLAGYFWINTQLTLGCEHKFLLIALLVTNITSISFTLLAIKPYLNSGTAKGNKSISFFGDVAQTSLSEYNKALDEISEANRIKDKECQCHTIAVGLRKKFKLLILTTWLIATQMLLIVIFGIMILTKI